jgi:hypothetical protein
VRLFKEFLPETHKCSCGVMLKYMDKFIKTVVVSVIHMTGNVQGVHEVVCSLRHARTWLRPRRLAERNGCVLCSAENRSTSTFRTMHRCYAQSLRFLSYRQTFSMAQALFMQRTQTVTNFGDYLMAVKLSNQWKLWVIYYRFSIRQLNLLSYMEVHLFLCR